MINTYIAKDQSLARLHGMFLTTAWDYIDGVWHKVRLSQVWLIILLDSGVKL